MDRTKGQALVEWMDRAAREAFEHQGNVMPSMALLDDNGRGLLMLMSTEGHPTDMAAALLRLTAGMVDTRWVCVGVEAFTKTYRPEDLPTDFRRGRYAMEADTDPEIHTSLVAIVYDVKDLDDCWQMLTRVTGDPAAMYESVVELGPCPGQMWEQLVQGYRTAAPAPAAPLETWAKVLVETGVVLAAVLLDTSPLIN